GTFHLPVAEQIHLGQQFFLEQLHAKRIVVAPIVAVGKMEGIDIPLIRRIAGIDKLVGQGIGGADLGAAAFARVVERVLVHFLGGGVMNNVDRLDSLIVGFDPGIDPEGLDADNVLLIVGHGAGHVHHVNDNGDALGLADFLPASILLVLADRNDQRPAGIV